MNPETPTIKDLDPIIGRVHSFAADSTSEVQAWARNLLGMACGDFFAEKLVYPVDSSGKRGYHEVFNHSSSTLYPNPATNLVTVGVNLPETNSIKIEMLDMLGRRVNAMVPGKKGAGTYRFQMNTSHLAAGMYVMKISIGEETITKKIQVQ